MTTKEYYEQRAEKELLWGGLREKSLAENIYSQLSKNPKNLLDAGCGDGYLIHYLQQNLFCDFWGFDLSTVRLKNLKERCPSVSINQGNLIKMPFKDNTFETVICSEVLEHIPNLQKALSELVRIAKKEILITVPNDQEPRVIKCPWCKKEHFLDQHLHRLNIEIFKQLLIPFPNVILAKTRKFNTIYSYNKITMKLPVRFRLLFDQLLISFEKKVSCLKPNFLLIKLIKK